MNKAIKTTFTFAFAAFVCTFAVAPAYATEIKVTEAEVAAIEQPTDAHGAVVTDEKFSAPQSKTDKLETDEGTIPADEVAAPETTGTITQETGASETLGSVSVKEKTNSDTQETVAQESGVSEPQGKVADVQKDTSNSSSQVATDVEQTAEVAANASANDSISMKTAKAKNGWVQENGKTHFYVNSKIQTGWAVTDSYKNYGLQRYWLGAYGDLVSSKIVNVDRAGYLTYCTSKGYVARYKYKETDGKLYLADNGGKLENTGWLVTGYYDGGATHRFYVDEKTHSARLGFFTVSGNKYYAYSDLGYVLHGDYDYIEGHWYTANNDGVLSNADSRFSRIETYVKWMLAIAADDSHGYDQTYRWGERGDYDCSSLVISAVRAAGIDTKWATYTGNMRSAFTSTGFYCRGFDNLKRGDILLNDTYHVAIYIGNGQLVHASGNEWGGATGGQPGDQTGTEICVRSYYNRPWNTVLRFNC